MNRIKRILTKGFQLYFKYTIRSNFRRNDVYHIQNLEPFAGSPIIILGMHRSGTTLLSKLLERQGVFMGHIKGRNTNESLLFQALNDSFLKFAHASWDHPEPFAGALSTEKIKMNLLLVLSKILTSRIMSFYKLNFKSLLHNRKDQMWCWKDPRSVFTFPIWSYFFPDAKFLFIYRNGIDVSQSLYERNKILSKRSDISLRTMDLSGGLELWREYNQKIEENLASIASENKLEICYEKLLKRPKEEMKRVCEFLNIPLDESSHLLNQVDSRRAFQFLKKPQLVDFYERNKSDQLFKKWGYDDLKNHL